MATHTFFLGSAKENLTIYEKNSKSWIKNSSHLFFQMAKESKFIKSFWEKLVEMYTEGNKEKNVLNSHKYPYYCLWPDLATFERVLASHYQLVSGKKNSCGHFRRIMANPILFKFLFCCSIVSLFQIFTFDRTGLIKIQFSDDGACEFLFEKRLCWVMLPVKMLIRLLCTKLLPLLSGFPFKIFDA